MGRGSLAPRIFREGSIFLLTQVGLAGGDSVPRTSRIADVLAIGSGDVCDFGPAGRTGKHEAEDALQHVATIGVSCLYVWFMVAR